MAKKNEASTTELLSRAQTELTDLSQALDNLKARRGVMLAEIVRIESNIRTQRDQRGATKALDAGADVAEFNRKIRAGSDQIDEHRDTIGGIDRRIEEISQQLQTKTNAFAVLRSEEDRKVGREKLAPVIAALKIISDSVRSFWDFADERDINGEELFTSVTGLWLREAPFLKFVPNFLQSAEQRYVHDGDGQRRLNLSEIALFDRNADLACRRDKIQAEARAAEQREIEAEARRPYTDEEFLGQRDDSLRFGKAGGGYYSFGLDNIVAVEAIKNGTLLEIREFGADREKPTKKYEATHSIEIVRTVLRQLSWAGRDPDRDRAAARREFRAGADREQGYRA